MIFDDLCRLYDLKLESDAVPHEGWSCERVSWELVIDSDGSLAAAVPLVTKASRYVWMNVPEQVTRTCGAKPFCLCDKVGILLGCGSKKKQEEHEKLIECHRAFFDGLADAGIIAFIHFLEADRKGELPCPIANRNLEELAVVRLLDDSCYIHERAAVRDYWDSNRGDWGRDLEKDLVKEDEVPLIQCSITGERTQPASLFPVPKGFSGVKPTASPVNYNCQSFCSYGMTPDDKAANSRMSARAAFKAGSALRYLVNDENHYVDFGQDRILFWTDEDDAESLDEISLFFGKYDKERAKGEDEVLLAEIAERLNSIREGRTSLGVDGSTKYYLMCLSRNGGRIPIRFYATGSMGSLEKRYAQYLSDIELEGETERPRSIRSYVYQTAPLAKAENIPATMVTSVMRSMLRGEPFPNSLYVQLLTRIRADKGYPPGKNGKTWDAMRLRVPMLKACLLRFARLHNDRETERSLTVSLNVDNVNKGYVLGRLFATLEKAQRDASDGELNTTIRDRYISAASMTPARVFPQLLRLAQYHVSKAEYGTFFEKTIESIMERLDSGGGFPATLSLQDQGQFYIGYYQQMQAFYKPRNKEN